jgi:hypothetical protein
MTEDEVRLAKLMLVLDGIGDIDLHERALEHAEKNGDLVAGAMDYCNAARDALDALPLSLAKSEYPDTWKDQDAYGNPVD